MAEICSRAIQVGLRHDRREIAAISLGGFAGAIARGALGQAVPVHSHQWPWATFTVNLAGAALLGYLAVRLREQRPPGVYRRPLLTTGFCGALTTFSTMQLELLRMLDGADYALAVAYALASVGGGYLVITAALRLTPAPRTAK